MSSDKRARILVVGAGSMLGGALLARKPPGLVLCGIPHTEISAAHVEGCGVVINMAYDPRYMSADYNPALDFDLKVAQLAAQAGRHFVMLSSRKVYGPSRQFLLAEDAPKNPIDPYGRNKLETEKRVQALLGLNCSILRLANVFDYEPSRHTFFGIALTSLRRKNCIVLDSNPLVKKDFIPLEDCIAGISRVLVQKPAGIFNLGYGTATEIGEIAQWLIEGYGRGEVVVTSDEMRDEFLLDVGRLTGLIGAPAQRTSVRDRCLEIGKQLQHA